VWLLYHHDDNDATSHHDHDRAAGSHDFDDHHLDDHHLYDHHDDGPAGANRRACRSPV
jgi:hypothetical protein